MIIWIFHLFLIPGLMFISLNLKAQQSDLSDDLRLLCTRETAYSTGVSDARKGLSRKENFAKICPSGQEYLNQAYNTGYNYGLANVSGLVIQEPAPAHPEIETQLPSSQLQPYTRPVPEYGPAQDQAIIMPAIPGVAVQPPPRQLPPGMPTPLTIPQAYYPYSGGYGFGHGAEMRGKQECIDTINGTVCGYNCKTSLDKAKCAKSPDELCIANSAGDIACGYHCSASYLTVMCAMYPEDNCVTDFHGHIGCGLNCRIENNEPVCDILRPAG